MVRTTIVLSMDTKTKLGEIGTTNESYEDVVKRLINDYNNTKNL